MLLEALSYSRQNVDDGQWWLLVTASLAHLSWAHLLGNLAAGFGLVVAFRHQLDWRRLAAGISLASVAVGAGIHGLTDLAWYAGLSGVLWAIAGQAALGLARTAPVTGRSLLACLSLVLVLEQSRTLSWSGEPLAPQAHLYGFVAGLVVILASDLLAWLLVDARRQPRPPRPLYPVRAGFRAPSIEFHRGRRPSGSGS